MSFEMSNLKPPIVLCLTLSILGYCLASLCESIYKVKSTCSINYGTPLSTYTNLRNRAECAVACSQDDFCLTSVFDGVNGICKTFSSYKAIEPCPTEEYYTAVFESTCHAPPVISGGILSPCDWNNECKVSDSECRGIKCQCIPGYSYNPVTKSCVNYCVEYGSTFQDDVGHLIVGFSNTAFGTNDPLECMSACVNETTFICRTVEMWTTAGVCYLSNETAYSQPQARDANIEYDLYQRDCAP